MLVALLLGGRSFVIVWCCYESAGMGQPGARGHDCGEVTTEGEVRLRRDYTVTGA
jgi:hypothetical protein